MPGDCKGFCFEYYIPGDLKQLCFDCWELGGFKICTARVVSHLCFECRKFYVNGDYPLCTYCIRSARGVCKKITDCTCRLCVLRRTFAEFSQKHLELQMFRDLGSHEALLKLDLSKKPSDYWKLPRRAGNLSFCIACCKEHKNLKSIFCKSCRHTTTDKCRRCRFPACNNNERLCEHCMIAFFCKKLQEEHFELEKYQTLGAYGEIAHLQSLSEMEKTSKQLGLCDE